VAAADVVGQAIVRGVTTAKGLGWGAGVGVIWREDVAGNGFDGVAGGVGRGPGIPAEQLYDALYRQRVESLEAVTALPAAMREGLAIGSLTASETYTSAQMGRRAISFFACRWEDGRDCPDAR
jgi:hypothetical protein